MNLIRLVTVLSAAWIGLAPPALHIAAGDQARYAAEMTRATARLLQQLGAPPAETGPPGPAFPLRVSENKRHLVDQRNKPFFVMGDTPWFLQKRKIEDVRRILDDRQAQGFNTLLPRGRSPSDP